MTKDEFHDFVTKCIHTVTATCTRAGAEIPEKIELLRGLCLADSRNEVLPTSHNVYPDQVEQPVPTGVRHSPRSPSWSPRERLSEIKKENDWLRNQNAARDSQLEQVESLICALMVRMGAGSGSETGGSE